MSNEENTQSEIERLKKRIEELETRDEPESLKGKELEGRVIGIGKDGDLLVNLDRENTPHFYVKSIPTKIPRVGDRVKVKVHGVNSNASWGAVTEVTGEKAKNVSHYKEYEKQEMLDEIQNRTDMSEDCFTFKNDGMKATLSHEGVYEVLCRLRVYDRRPKPEDGDEE